MKRVDLIPLAYWMRTRAAGTMLVSQLLVWPILQLVVMLYAAGGRVGEESIHFGLAWMAFLSLYELGYFTNDFWSQPREILRGVRQHKPYVPLAAETRWRLAFALIIRIAFALGIAGYLARSCDPSVVTALTLVTGSTLVVFALHNIVFVPYRVGTLAVLHVGKVAIVVPFVIGTISPWALTFALIVPPVAFSLAYGVNKRVFLPSLRPVTGNINFQFGVAALVWASAGVAASMAGIGGASLLLLLAAYAVMCSVVMTSLRMGRAWYRRRARQDDCYHVHTCYSHDCDLSLATVRELAADAGYRRVYIADHAETFDAEKYDRLVRECAEYNRLTDGLPELIPGLEYPIHTQHILAIGLSRHVNVHEDNIGAVASLHKHCQEVIWAHPHFAIRRLLFERRYQRRYLAMMNLATRFEVVNHKSLRGIHFRWRHWGVAIVAMYLFGGKEVHVGVDAHTIKDWKQDAARRRQSVPRRRMVTKTGFPIPS